MTIKDTNNLNNTENSPDPGNAGGIGGNGNDNGNRNGGQPPRGLKKVFINTPRWFFVIAIISLSINLLIIGSVGSKIVFYALDDDHVSAFGFSSNVRQGYRFYKNLPKDKKDHLKYMMRGFGQFAREKEIELNQYTMELKKVIAQENLTEADLKAVSHKFFLAGNDFFDNFEKDTVEFILSLSYEDRLELSKMINFDRPRPFKYHGRGHRFKPDDDDDWD